MQNTSTNPINQKLFPYDTTGMATTFKNPYEIKMIGKIGPGLKNPKKKEEIKWKGKKTKKMRNGNEEEEG